MGSGSGVGLTEASRPSSTQTNWDVESEQGRRRRSSGDTVPEIQRVEHNDRPGLLLSAQVRWQGGRKGWWLVGRGAEATSEQSGSCTAGGGGQVNRMCGREQGVSLVLPVRPG